MTDKRKPFPEFGTNIGHGHVWTRPDGILAKCGGPALCAECARWQGRVIAAMDAVAGSQHVDASGNCSVCMGLWEDYDTKTGCPHCGYKKFDKQQPNEAGPQHVDASGDPRQTWPTQRWRDEVLGPPEGGGVYTPDMGDKQQPDARHEWSERLRDHEYILSLGECRAIADSLDAQAAEIAELRKNLECSEALREALEKVRQRCLVDEDDGRIAVTCDVVIEYELFDEICAALEGTSDE